MFENSLNSSINFINTIVDSINSILNKITPGFSVYWVALMAIAFGYLLKIHLTSNDKRALLWWIFFALLIFMSMRYLGFGA